MQHMIHWRGCRAFLSWHKWAVADSEVAITCSYRVEHMHLSSMLQSFSQWSQSYRETQKHAASLGFAIAHIQIRQLLDAVCWWVVAYHVEQRNLRDMQRALGHRMQRALAHWRALVPSSLICQLGQLRAEEACTHMSHRAVSMALLRWRVVADDVHLQTAMMIQVSFQCDCFSLPWIPLLLTCRQGLSVGCRSAKR